MLRQGSQHESSGQPATFFTTSFRKLLISISFFLGVLSFFSSGCSKVNEDIYTEAGRDAIVDDTLNNLTVGNCQGAYNLLEPLYSSTYVTNDVRMLFASVYGCFGGIDFTQIISTLKDGASDIWSPFVKSNYSTGTDGKTEALLNAADVLRATASTSGSFSAASRDDDANTYMIVVQLEVLVTTIASPAGASKTTGHQQVAGWPATTTNTQRCYAAVAMATIQDSLINLSSQGAFKNIATTLSSACGGVCPSTLDISACGVTEYNQGLVIFTAISSQWAGPP